MRNVAVTDGDKIEAQIKLGWTVDYWGVGDLVEYVNSVDESDIDKLYDDLQDQYDFVQGDNSTEKFEHNVKYQLREYIGIKKFLDDKGYSGFTTNFEDLVGLEQLPGLAAQLLMADGYGFAGEGDWKTAALTRLLKIVSHNQATAFMEDYTLDLRKGHEAILGSHMLEVDPTIASDKPRVEVHPLDIGGKEDPARLVFTGRSGDAVDVTLADFGDEFKLISYDVTGNKQKQTHHISLLLSNCGHRRLVLRLVPKVLYLFFRKDWHLTDAGTIGWITSTLMLGAILGGALAGQLSDKLGRRRMILASSFVFALGAIMAGFSPDDGVAWLLLHDSC
ncbi:hypothetical protein Pfo_031554 [Paulownia fortunei]|nr:hypothetical protein Pfo_031554 [Paulownia fortunei]